MGEHTQLERELIMALELCLPVIEAAYEPPCPLDEEWEGQMCRECEADGCLHHKIEMAKAALSAASGRAPTNKEE